MNLCDMNCDDVLKWLSTFMSNSDIIRKFKDANIIQDEEVQCIAVQDNSDADELETLERTRSSENDIDWPLFTSLIDEEDDMEQFTINTFDKYYTRFLLDLREDALFKIIQHQATQSSTSLLIPLEDIEKLISQIITSISNITKNDYQFSKRCEEYFGIKNLLNKPDVISYLVDNLNDNITQTKNNPDLMLTYRDGTAAKDNPSLKLYPNSFLIQLYSDGIGITNPIGPKKDEHKLTLYYFVLEDLPDLVRSMLQSIGLVGICPTKYLSLQTNRIKYFEPIVKDLNYLQTTRLAVQTFNGQLHFGFSLLAADNLAAHEIGGFQRNFNSGQFCRLCHISYQFRLTSLTDISFLPRTITTHNAYVQEAANSFNTRTIAGVVGDSPLSDLIGFHPIKSLPRDVMHDFAEDVCPLIVVAMLKEASAKRLMTYDQIEQKMNAFVYGMNDQNNKPPIIRTKHLRKNHIVGSASQKLCLFKLMPIIFYDIIDQLTNTLDIYTCLHEIISYTRQDSEDPGYLIFSP
ncbi:unnamed protein product [Rotaria sordida]|uniref:Uncharacterized protein n=1 Tax=Rotaria sordida TaxID=392033 RepID=A0A819LXH5_9BILA|nr:unnamed protein product [Rotaria sordida]